MEHGQVDSLTEFRDVEVCILEQWLVFSLVADFNRKVGLAEHELVVQTITDSQSFLLKPVFGK